MGAAGTGSATGLLPLSGEAIRLLYVYGIGDAFLFVVAA